jgi:hypothetical protein
VRLTSLRLPDGFRVEAALRFADVRADSLALLGDAVFWFDHQTSTVLSGASVYHRIERLDLDTLAVTTVFESAAPLTLFTTWTHGLIVVTESPPSGHVRCVGDCVRPVVEAIDFRNPAAEPKILARADAQPLANVALTLQSWRPGVLFQLVQHERNVLHAWRWVASAGVVCDCRRVIRCGL